MPYPIVPCGVSRRVAAASLTPQSTDFPLNTFWMISGRARLNRRQLLPRFIVVAIHFDSSHVPAWEAPKLSQSRCDFATIQIRSQVSWARLRVKPGGFPDIDWSSQAKSSGALNWVTSVSNQTGMSMITHESSECFHRIDHNIYPSTCGGAGRSRCSFQLGKSHSTPRRTRQRPQVSARLT